jgi:hypothetical protein
MSTPHTSRFGDLPPRYKFMLNPYPDRRLYRCPHCDGKLGQRKLPLLIHVDPDHLIALNYTCRYCPACDLLIGHKAEIEHLLYQLFSGSAPEVVGNDYLIIGTLGRKTWREGVKQPQGLQMVLPNVSDFKTYYSELRMSRPGWYRGDQEPPIMEPPPAQEWLKRSSRHKA